MAGALSLERGPLSGRRSSRSRMSHHTVTTGSAVVTRSIAVFRLLDDRGGDALCRDGRIVIGVRKLAEASKGRDIHVDNVCLALGSFDHGP